MQPDGQMAELPDAGAQASRSALPSARDRGGLPCWLPVSSPTHRPVSPMPLCPDSPQGGPRGAPGWRHRGAPTASQKHHLLTPPSPARSLAFSSETCDLPTTLGRWACPGPVGAHRSLTATPRSTGFWRDWQEGPGGRDEAGGLPPDSLGPLSLVASAAHMHTHAHTVVHTRIDTLIHSHIHTQLHTHAHSHPHTDTHAFSRLHISSTHIRAHTYMQAHTLAHTLTPSCILTRAHTHAHSLDTVPVR